MKTEAVRWSAAVTGLVEAIVPVLLLFGLIHWSPEQIGAVVLAIGVAVKFVGQIVTRNMVWSAASYDRDMFSTGEPEPPPA